MCVCRVACVLLCLCGCSDAAMCLNEDGQPVDWFIIYKLPKLLMAGQGSGVDYMYLDPTLKNFQMSKHNINSTEGAVAQTLTQLYSAYGSHSSVYLLYNDSPPELKFLSHHGHTKGLLLFSQFQGFWITHSVPHFPPFPEKGFSFPSSGKLYGQMLQCVSFGSEQLPLISWQLSLMDPRVYNCSVPPWFRQKLQVLADVCAGESRAVNSSRRLEKLLSSSGQTFFSFAKSYRYADDIYVAWVAQALAADLLVESWLHQPQPLPSNCSLPRHVLNVARVWLPGSRAFSSYHDHAKWCVSRSSPEPWMCVGDLNRDSGQMSRGGGLICSQHPASHDSFLQAVARFQSCEALTPGFNKSIPLRRGVSVT